jgi:hypothetical protein
VSHHLLRRLAERRTEAATDDGVVIPSTALLLIPMLLFAALAVDVGAWYADGLKAQRAADAASLAGVPRLPDLAEATAEAKATAARNGYIDQPGCDTWPCTPASFPQVIVTRTAQDRLRVDIVTSSDFRLGRLISNTPITITRGGEAENVPPLPIGNPTSALGTGADPSAGSYTSNYWLRASPDCAARGNGDFIGAGGGCPNANPNHVDAGHTFIIDVPLAEPYLLQARTTCYDRDGFQANAPISLTLYPSDGTPYDDDDNLLLPPVASVTVNRPAATTCPVNGSGWSRFLEPAPWVTIAPINAQGRYVLQAKNPSTNQFANATYSLRLVPTGANNFTTCSRIGPTGSAGCPNIQAKDYLTTLTPTEMFPPGGGRAELYLAEVGEVHAGKKMEVEVFDPADGVAAVRVLDPQGNYVPFSWYTIDCAEYGYNCGAGDYGGPGAMITQTCAGSPCMQEVAGLYRFDDRTAILEVDLPNNYSCVQNPGEPENCWWKIELEYNTDSIEAMTWGVSIAGNPVRLVE